MILAGLRELARALGCRDDQADDVVKSAPSARMAMSRRGFFRATGAVAAGTLYAFGAAQTEPFFGIDRAVGVERLSGVRLSGISATTFSAFLKERYRHESIDRYVHRSPVLIWMPTEKGIES